MKVWNKINFHFQVNYHLYVHIWSKFALHVHCVNMFVTFKFLKRKTFKAIEHALHFYDKSKKANPKTPIQQQNVQYLNAHAIYRVGHTDTLCWTMRPALNDC